MENRQAVVKMARLNVKEIKAISEPGRYSDGNGFIPEHSAERYKVLGTARQG